MPPRPRPPAKHPSPSQPSGPPTTAPPRRPNRNPRKRHHRRRRSTSPRAASEPDDSGPGDLYVPVELAALGPFGVFFVPADEQGGREGEGGGAEGRAVEREEEREEQEQGEGGDELPDIVTGEVNAPGFMVFARERRAAEGEVAGDLAEHRKRYGKASEWLVEE